MQQCSAIELCLYFSWVRGSISPEALVVFMVASFVIPSCWRFMACEVTGNEDIFQQVDVYYTAMSFQNTARTKGKQSGFYFENIARIANAVQVTL